MLDTATDYLINVVPFAGMLLSSVKKRPRRDTLRQGAADAQTPGRNVKFSSPVVQSEIMVSKYIGRLDTSSGGESIDSDDASEDGGMAGLRRNLFSAPAATPPTGGGEDEMPDLTPRPRPRRGPAPLPRPSGRTWQPAQGRLLCST